MENWSDSHNFEDIDHLVAGFEGFVRVGWANRFEESLMVVW